MMPLPRTLRRVGRVVITREMIDDNLARSVYDEIMPVDVRCDPMTGNIDVAGWSDQFDELKSKFAIPIREAPFYSISFDAQGKVTFHRCDEPANALVTPDQATARALLRITRDLPMYFSKAELEAKIRAYAWGDALLKEYDLLPQETSAEPQEGANSASGQNNDAFGEAIRKAIDIGRF